MASLPHENELELHVRKIPGGAMSEWLHHLAAPDIPPWLHGPSGNCFYTPGNNDEPLLLAGTGTGLAPLYGVLRDALLQGHQGPVWLTKELVELCAAHPNFHYVRSVLREGDGTGADVGELDKCILSRFASHADAFLPSAS